jgi:hypothetical protein
MSARLLPQKLDRLAEARVVEVVYLRTTSRPQPTGELADRRYLRHRTPGLTRQKRHRWTRGVRPSGTTAS